MNGVISPCLATIGDVVLLPLLDAVVKATVLIMTAYLATVLIRPSSAALRHRIWSTAFGCLLVLPVLSAILPDLRIPIAPRLTSAQHDVSSPTPEALPVADGAIDEGNTQTNGALLEELLAAEAPNPVPADTPLPPADLLVPSSQVPVPHAASTAPRSAWRVSWRSLLVLVWLAGTGLALVPIGVRLIRNRLVVRSSTTVLAFGPHQTFDQLRRSLGIRRSIRLLETEKSLVPMTWGVLRPIVLVPQMWREWSYERQRIVLLHELVHVKRWDTLFQMLARLTCAIYWFHPLVWYLLRHLRTEREMACDDCVLMAGERPTDYANHILEIARDYRTLTLVAAVAMAQPTGLETRIRAMLDRTRSRLPISFATEIAILAGAAILSVGVAMAKPSTSLPVEPRTAVSAAANQMPAVEPSVTLSGHTSGVWLVGFDPKGRRLISTGRDGTVNVWSPPRNKARATWAAIEQESESHDQLELHSSALSGDGKTLAVASSDSLITLWDAANGEKLHVLKGHVGAILALAFSPDGKTLVSGGIDRILRLWNTETGEPVREGYDGNSFRIQALAVSPDGEVIVSGDRDNVVKFWKMHEKRYISSLPPDGSVLAVACAANNNGLAAGLDHGRIIMWTGSVAMQSKRHILPGHRGDVTALAFTPDGAVLASTGVDGVLMLWDATTGRRIAMVHAHPGGARCLAFSANGSSLVTGGEDREVRIWNVAELKQAGPPARRGLPIKEPQRSLKVARHEAEVTARIKMLNGAFLATGTGGSWSPDGSQLAFGTPEGGIGVVDLKTGRQRTLVDQGCNPAWSPMGDVIAFVRGDSGEEEICLRGDSKNETIRLVDGLGPVWHSDGATLFFTDHDKTLNAVSRLPNGKVSEPRVVARSSANADGQRLPYASQNGVKTIVVRSEGISPSPLVVGDRDISYSPHTFGDRRFALAWSSDGRQIAIGAHNVGLRIFDSTGNRPAMQVIRSRVDRPAWSPDGRKIAFDVTLAGNREIWMLETESLEALQAFHTTHHPKETPAFLDSRAPFEPQGRLVPLDLALKPDPRFPAGALGNPLDDLGDLPRGDQTLAGVSFQIGERPIQLGCEYLPQAPDQVVGIPVQRNVARIYVLHAAGYADPYLGNRRSDTIENYVPRPFRSKEFDGVPDGTIIAYYRVCYADGSDQWIAVAEGHDVRDWCRWAKPSPSRGTIAWRTRNELTRVHGYPICLFAGAWQNPYPERKVATIEYISAGTRAAPFCAAITVEEP